jgi:hypothetical protein
MNARIELDNFNFAVSDSAQGFAAGLQQDG